MAKKSRKARAANRVTTAPHAAVASQSQAGPAAQRSSKQPQVANTGAPQATDYGYVSKDLINIGIIAAALILVLIILTFIPALNT